MPNHVNPRITLELESGADPIRGTLERGNRSPLRFWGWLELMEELRRVATEHPEQPSEPSPAKTGQSPQPEARAVRRQPRAGKSGHTRASS